MSNNILHRFIEDDTMTDRQFCNLFMDYLNSAHSSYDISFPIRSNDENCFMYNFLSRLLKNEELIKALYYVRR